MSALRRILAAVTGLLTTLTTFALLAPIGFAQALPPDRSTATSELSKIARSVTATIGVDLDLCNIQSRLEQLPPLVRRQMMTHC